MNNKNPVHHFRFLYLLHHESRKYDPQGRDNHWFRWQRLFLRWYKQHPRM